MAKIDMVMPQMGESIAEGTIIKWLKKEGDKVELDEIILEISTDKVDSEIPSPQAGILTKLLAAEGETVDVGAVIAHIEGAGEGAAATAKESVPEPQAMADIAEPAAAQAPAPEIESAPAIMPPVEEITVVSEPKPAPQVPEFAPSDFTAIPRTDQTGKKFYSPLVRSIAKAEGLSPQELATINGSGVSGRVTKKDVLGYLSRRAPGIPEIAPSVPATGAAPTPAYVPPAQPEFEDARVEVIPMNSMRKSIAKHMVASVQTSPHVFAITEADMSNLVTFREKEKAAFLRREGFKLTYMPYIIHASAQALRDFPLVNSSVDGDKIVRKKFINVGVAVALANSGLIVPVIKGADGMNIVGLARVGNDLAQRARSKKLKPEEVRDGTFSITNMGVFGSLMGLPIINQPQVAILGMGVIQKRAVVRNDAIAIRDMIYLSLSFDHRIVDGALAGQFLERIAFYLTNFDPKNTPV